ncbi:hypothetical protein ABZ570_21000 [Micromonospora sp. NPDC007271]
MPVVWPAPAARGDPAARLWRLLDRLAGGILLALGLRSALA